MRVHIFFSPVLNHNINVFATCPTKPLHFQESATKFSKQWQQMHLLPITAACSYDSSTSILTVPLLCWLTFPMNITCSQVYILLTRQSC